MTSTMGVYPHALSLTCPFIPSCCLYRVMFAKKAVEYAEPTKTISLPYQYGRTDNTDCQGGAGRLPGAQGGLGVINKVFVQRMGLTMNDAVTLLGAHTLGHVKVEYSGYGFANETNDVRTNAWDVTPTTFDNQYYHSLLTVSWAWTQPVLDGPSRSIFDDGAVHTIMLGTDMVLGFPVNTTAKVAGFEVGLPNQVCGPKAVNGQYGCVIDSANGHGAMTRGGINGDKTRAPSRTGLNRAGPRRRLDAAGAEGVEGAQVQLEGVEEVQVQGSAPPPPAGTPPPPAGTPPPPAGTPPPPTTSTTRVLSTTKPATFALAAQYAASNRLFLQEFAKSFAKMTTVGYGTPAAAGATTSGKLGKVTGIDLSKCPV